MHKVPFFRPNIEEIDPKVLKRAFSGDYEGLLADYEGVCEGFDPDESVAVNNPSSAIHLALMSLDLKRGDKILVSTNAHPALAGMVRHFDSEPIFVDIEKKSYNIDPDSLQAVIKANKSKKLRGIIVNFVAGKVPDLERIYKIAKENSLFIIEEKSGLFGLDYPNRDALSAMSDISICSILPIDFESASNVAVLLIRDEKVKKRAVLLRDHAKDKSHTPTLGYSYDILDIGCGYLPSPLDLAYALEEGKNAKEYIAKRAKIAQRYSEAFADTPHIETPDQAKNHAWNSYIIKIDKNRDDFARSLMEMGIEVSLRYVPLHMMTYYRNKYGLKITSHKAALSNYSKILSLPIFASMSENETNLVIKAVKSVAAARVW